MAEAAAIAYGAVEAVETTAQIGVGAYMVAKPTLPLKATFTQIATSTDDETRLSLCRSDHTLSVVGTNAYIFGGETAAGKLAGNEIHVVKLESSPDNLDPDYSVKPALPLAENGEVPAARMKHAACAVNDCVAVYGGVNQEGSTIDDNTIWMFHTQELAWEALNASDVNAAPRARRNASLFEVQEDIVLSGGIDSSGADLKDVWMFKIATREWHRLPNAPVPIQDAVVSDKVLYLVSSNDNVSGDVHFLPLYSDEEEDTQTWDSIPFPTNPLTPGPQPRTEGGTLRVSTGYGRNYLVYIFGKRPNSIAPPSDSQDTKSASTDETQPTVYHSDTWVYQLPSSKPELKATTHIYDALKPAALKDYIRNALGFSSGKHSWAEVEIIPPPDLPDAVEGKLHPGPRARFGRDVMADGKGVVIWGGVNAKGETEGDGWLVKFE